MQNAKELNDVVPRPPPSFHNFIGFGAPEEQGVDDGSELNLDLSLGRAQHPPAISRSSSSAAAGKGALSSSEKHQVDPNPKPARIPAWVGAHRKVEGSSSSETNTLAAPLPATGTDKEKMARIIPSDGNRKRERGTEASTEITKAMPRVYSNGVEGILYNYTSKHNISIVCLCHGELHTPAEFVRHSGGGDVPNPMKCITVSRRRRLQ